MFGIGPAGTGKTYLAMAQAVAFLIAKKVSRIILARPAVEAGEKLGFLPGDLQEKVNPYLRPLYDALYDMLDVERVARYIERGTIEIAPIAFMRGRTLNDSFVILDEAQNTTTEQMKMFLTRLGFGAKAVITGDITQIDLPSGRTSGLVEATGRGRGSTASRSCGSTSATSCATSSCGRSSWPTTRIRTATATDVRRPAPGAANRRSLGARRNRHGRQQGRRLRVLVGDEQGRAGGGARSRALARAGRSGARARHGQPGDCQRRARPCAESPIPRSRLCDRRPVVSDGQPAANPPVAVFWATS